MTILSFEKASLDFKSTSRSLKIQKHFRVICEHTQLQYIFHHDAMLMFYRLFQCECLNNTIQLQTLNGALVLLDVKGIPTSQFIKADDTRKPENAHPHQLTH